MTDWDQDVDDLIRLYENPDAFTNDQTVDLVLRFWRMFLIMWPPRRNLPALVQSRMFLMWASLSKTLIDT
jgi:hypothetical protein